MASTTRRAQPERISSRSVASALDEEPDSTRTGVVAVALALAGATIVSIAPLLGAVRADADGDWSSGALPGAVWAAGCAFVPAVFALLALVARRIAVSGALLAGSGVVALGAAVVDAQLWTDAVDSNRLELFRPETAVDLVPGPGAYAVLAGHLVLVLAGLLGIFAVHRASLADGYGAARSSDMVGRSTGARIGFALSALVVLAALVLAGSLFASPFSSSDPMILVPSVVDSDATAAAGAAIVAVAVLLVVASSLASISPPVAGAAVVGAGVAALAVVGTRFVSALTAVDRVDPGVGSTVGTIAAVIVVVAGLAIVPVDRVRDRTNLRGLAVSGVDAGERAGKGAVTPSAKGVAKAAMRAEAEAAAQRRTRWHVVTGVVGVLAGALACVGALLPTLDVGGAEAVALPQIHATRLVLVAGALLVIASVWLLFSEFAAAVRPAVGVVWAAVPVTVTGVSASALTAADVPGVSLGAGVLVMWVSAAAAVGTGFLAVLAGSAEREEVDESDDRSVNKAVLLVGGVGALATVVGLALPLYTGTDARGDEFVTAGLTDYDRGLEWWVPALLTIVVLVAVAVASRSRPARAAAVLLGSAAVTVVYLLGWPLTSGRVDDVRPGAGVVAVGLGIVLIGAAALLTSSSKRR